MEAASLDPTRAPSPQKFLVTVEPDAPALRQNHRATVTGETAGGAKFTLLVPGQSGAAGC